MFRVEMTDTYGGEANYSWVKRETIAANSHKQAITKFKKLHGITTGHRISFDGGDMRRVDFSGACICIFSTWADSGDGVS